MLSSTIRCRLVQSSRAALGVALLLAATAFQSAGAQQAARLRVAVDAAPRAVQPSRPASFRPVPAAADSTEHSNPRVHGAKVGALVGVAAGLVYTLALNTTKSCTEKNNVVCAEDQHDYRTFTYPILGGLIGAVVGAVVGSARE
ncbi:MAG: hypothetical protein JF589_08405 [Gemmatimonadetes bacterium]|nr:hypothetical protein [Gemmatimonadota bacterium]